jgi:hypothetical protein
MQGRKLKACLFLHTEIYNYRFMTFTVCIIRIISALMEKIVKKPKVIVININFSFPGGQVPPFPLCAGAHGRIIKRLGQKLEIKHKPWMVSPPTRIL